MKTKSILIALLALVLAFPSLAGAAPVGKLTSVEGKVDITSPGKEAKLAHTGDAVNVGDILRTKSKSKCEVTFGDGNVLRLAENTRLKITQYMFDKGPRNEVLNLFRGKIQNIVQKVTDTAGPEKGGRYEIHTPTAVCGVRGTNFFAFHQSGVTGAIFKEGIGYGYSNNRPQDVRTINPGQAMVVTNPNLPPTIKPATPLELDKHQKDTAPAEKKAEDKQKDGDDKKSETLASKTDNGPKDDNGKKEEEGKKTEGDKPAETQLAKKDDSSQTGGGDTGNGTSNGPSGAPAGFGAGGGEDSGAAPGGLLLTTLLPDAPQILEGKGPTNNPVVQPPPAPAKVEVPFEQGDSTPPEISFSATPAALTKSATATFTLASNETGTTYSYSTDGINYTNVIGSTVSLSGLSEGQHTIYVKATDAAGNSSATPISYLWETHYTAPVITLSGTPAAVTKAHSADFGVTADEQVTYTYTLNGQTVTSPTLTDLPEGSNTFTVKATDAAGNEATKTYTWETHYTAPVITLSGTPAAVTKAHSADFGVTADEQVTYAYTLNGQAVTSPTLTDLPEGSNTFTVKATDAAGNEATKTYTWETHYTAPVITLSGTPAPLTKARSADFGVTADEQATYAYTLNGQTVTSPTLTNLPEGSNTFTVKATDAAGNEATKTYTWTTDYTAPEFTISPEAAPAADGMTELKVALSGDETAAFSSSLDGAVPVAGAFLDLEDLGTGAHTLQVEAKDEAGNTRSQSLSFTLSRYPLSGSFYGCIGGVYGTASGEVAGVSGQSWGGWKLAMTGTGNYIPNASWTLAAGGQNDDGSYWLSVAPGASSFDTEYAGTLAGTSTLTYLSPTRMGIGTGNVEGTFNNGNYNLTDTGTGSYTESPLYFSGDWEHTTFYNDYGSLGWNNSDIGAFGFKKRPEGNYDFLAVGDFTDYGYGAEDYGGPYLWGGSLWEGGQTGNGYLEGFTGGIWKKDAPSNTYGTLKGYTAALYYNTENGEVGLVKGDLSGGFYNMNYGASGMWKAQSGADGLTAIDKTLSLPVDFDVSTAVIESPQVDDYPLYAYATGSFVGNEGNGGSIWGEYYDGETRFITYTDADGETRSLPFGFYALQMGYGWDVNYSGKPALTAPVSWHAKIGGEGYFGADYSADSGYWLTDITDGAWEEYSPEAGHGTINGNLNGKYLTRTQMGSIGGPFYGLYTQEGFGDDGSEYGTWVGESIGTYEGQPLAWSGDVDYDSNDYGLYHADGAGISGSADTSGGLLGGLTAPWSGSTGLSYLGKYYYIDETGRGPYLWTAPVYSYNYKLGDNTTYDGGAFFGLTSGVWQEAAADETTGILKGAIDARNYALYASPEGKAGILKGTLAGDYYPDIEMYQADGTWTAVELEDSGRLVSDVSGLWAANPQSAMDNTLGETDGHGSFDGTDSSIDRATPDGPTAYEARIYSLPDHKFALWQAVTGGEYTGTPSDTWYLSTNYTENYTDIYGTTHAGIMGSETIGRQWSANKLLGDTFAFAADITPETPFTWIGAGETLGTFNPSSLSAGTWQAVQGGVYLETSFFLDLAATEVGRAKLQQLNIPAIEVGKTTLSGSTTYSYLTQSGTLNVSLNDVTFFAASTGTKPRLWATNNITGSYSNGFLNYTNAIVPLDGENGLTADFTIKKWEASSTSKWLAAIENGTGAYSGIGSLDGSALNFRGAAAGTVNPEMHTFSAGSASGVILPRTFIDTTYAAVNDPASPGSFAGGAGSINLGGSATYEARTQGTPGNKYGSWQADLGGNYTGTLSDSWYLKTDYSNGTDSAAATIVSGTETVGSTWSSNTLAGETMGFAADMRGTPSTWIGVGSTNGSFDANAKTWQALEALPLVDTAFFFNLLQNNPAKLAQLNIPAIEVGRTTLSGAANGMNVNMNNVVFFAKSTGGAPRIWATNNVAGGYNTSNNYTGAMVPLTGSNGLNANFNVVNWNTSNGKWLSTVTNGQGTYSGSGSMNGTNVNFRGAAAGKIDTAGPGTFSGTAAGVVKP